MAPRKTNYSRWKSVKSLELKCRERSKKARAADAPFGAFAATGENGRNDRIEGAGRFLPDYLK